MPYKDKEKARASKRKYDREKREVRGCNWVIIVYPDSAPENWREILDDLHVPIFISPLHDKDVNADGEPKKPHWHVLFMWESEKSLTQMRELSEQLNAPVPKKQDSKRGAARYLCHLDNPEKAQYPIEDVVCLAGADYALVISMANDKYEVIHELKQWIKANPDIHRWAFNRVFDWCEENNEKWFRGLCDNCGWIIKEYLKAAYWDSEKNLYTWRPSSNGLKEEAARLAMAPIVARDENGNRICVCKECGKVDQESEFAVYGGEESPNLGLCCDCAYKGAGIGENSSE